MYVKHLVSTKPTQQFPYLYVTYAYMQLFVSFFFFT